MREGIVIVFGMGLVCILFGVYAIVSMVRSIAVCAVS